MGPGLPRKAFQAFPLLLQTQFHQQGQTRPKILLSRQEVYRFQRFRPRWRWQVSQTVKEALFEREGPNFSRHRDCSMHIQRY